MPSVSFWLLYGFIFSADHITLPGSDSGDEYEVEEVWDGTQWRIVKKTVIEKTATTTTSSGSRRH